MVKESSMAKGLSLLGGDEDINSGLAYVFYDVLIQCFSLLFSDG